MTAPAIRIDNLGKRYRIGLEHSTSGGGHFRYKSLRDSLVNTAKRPWSVVTANRKLTEDNSFWALRDISFEVQPGEVVGIIGRNGAGKSTLLKILSRITKPTTGHVELRGRVGSLLEVGTGFHPELTGRENIFLNGAILGMTRAEVRRKFDEIVAFSEIERFLDTPVKQYSSGMYTRLAFAVAAHLDPEILVVDEVLAVGDAAFQKKCLGKMKDVAGEGRTVLFVSHNMAAMSALCPEIVLLEHGRLTAKSTSEEIIPRYCESQSDYRGSRGWVIRNQGVNVELSSFEVRSRNRRVSSLIAGLPVELHLQMTVRDLELIGCGVSISVIIYSDGVRLANLWTDFARKIYTKNPKIAAVCRIPKWPIRNAEIRFDVYIHCGTQVEDWIEHAAVIQSIDGDYYGAGTTAVHDKSAAYLEHDWS